MVHNLTFQCTTVWARRLIGVAMGLISFFLRQTIGIITSKKFDLVEKYLHEDDGVTRAWLFAVLYSLALALTSAGP